MNKRAWLRSQGFVVGQRGRLQPAAQAALDKAVADGVDFDSNVVNTRHGVVVIPKRRRKKTGKVKPTPPPDCNWVFMREIQTGPDLPMVCDRCLYSVGWCQCGQTIG